MLSGVQLLIFAVAYAVWGPYDVPKLAPNILLIFLGSSSPQAIFVADSTYLQ
jgi:hypothetical protein